ncbi:TPA: glycosyltransferase family 4 protein [Streptococcus suis]|nr:glycosyltransferase family 4 protein [Streptococcus suis]
MSKKILVLAEDYPNKNGGVTLMYIHTRNTYYKQMGIEVTVLNFSAKKSYDIDGISVITQKDYHKINKNYDILVIHAANIKHHYLFIRKFGSKFEKFLFFFHGHEVMRITKSYPAPYPFISRDRFREFYQDRYDLIKLFIWKKYLPKIAYKSHFVFVSQWMKDEFYKWTKLPYGLLDYSSSIIYNCIGEEFEKNIISDVSDFKYDFVTIRNNLDGSKYGIDIVNQYAKNTPKARFLVIGKGEYFTHFEKSSNIEWRNHNLSHTEIVEILSYCKFAFMPTKVDAQGLMMCEMAALGIPVITSNIPVCDEVFADFENVYLIDNDVKESSLDFVLNNSRNIIKDSRFFAQNTIMKEVDLILNM